MNHNEKSVAGRWDIFYYDEADTIPAAESNEVAFQGWDIASPVELWGSGWGGWFELDADENGPRSRWDEANTKLARAPLSGNDEHGSTSISQTIAVEEGNVYELSFDFKGRKNRGYDENVLQVTISGATAGASETYTRGSEEEARETITFTATSTGDVTVAFADAGIDNTYGTLIRDVILERIAVWDIDTDSDNDGDVDRSDAEDDLEAVSGNDIGEVGKRIFLNTDDDNKNGKADTEDAKSDYTGGTNNFTDNDFAKIVLDVGGDLPLKEAGDKLYLIADAGLHLFADTQKTLLADATNAPGSSTAEVYIWTVGTDTFGDGTQTFYVEGAAVGAHEVRWELQKPNGTVVASDVVEINVEKIVYPYQNQTHGNWNDRPTSEWDGLNVADAWWMDKTLEDYIKSPGEKGELATIHPNFGTMAKDYPGGDVSGPDSTSTDTFGNGFTMEFDFVFDRTRGDGTNGYVAIDRDGNGPGTPRQKLSFVGNSGLKFGAAARPSANGAIKDYEIAILDVQSMVGKSGGLNNFSMDSSGIVDVAGYEKSLSAH